MCCPISGFTTQIGQQQQRREEDCASRSNQISTIFSFAISRDNQLKSQEDNQQGETYGERNGESWQAESAEIAAAKAEV